tara:strand:- start:1304 stop:1468 length:165 start_codon:yes stop_codon:yes gene_type:complete
MKDWRNSGVRPLIDRKEGCRHCMTSRGLKKIKDVVSRTANKLRELWQGRKKEEK